MSVVERAKKFMREIFRLVSINSEADTVMDMVADDAIWVSVISDGLRQGKKQLREVLAKAPGFGTIKFTMQEDSVRVMEVTENHCLLSGDATILFEYESGSAEAEIYFTALIYILEKKEQLLYLQYAMPVGSGNMENLMYQIASHEENVEISQELREATEELGSLMHNIDGGVLTCQNGGCYKIKYANDGFYSMLGYTPEEYKAENNGCLAAAIDEKYREQTVEEIAKQISETDSCSSVFKMLRKNGESFWAMAKSRLIHNRDGEELLHCVITDITKEREHEEELRISQRRYEIAIEYADVNIFDYTPNCEHMEYMYEKNGRGGFDTIIDNAVESMIASGEVMAEDANKVRQLYAKIDKGDPIAQENIRVIGKRGDETVTKVTLINIYDDDGNPVRTVGVAKDITKSVQLEQEKMYTEALDPNRLITLEVNLSMDKLVSVNLGQVREAGMYANTCYSESLAGMINLSVHDSDKSELLAFMSVRNLMENFGMGKTTLRTEYMRKNTSGDYAWVEQVVSIIKAAESEDTYARIYVTDIDAKKRKQLDLEQNQRLYDVMLDENVHVYEVNVTDNHFLCGHEEIAKLLGRDGEDNYELLIGDMLDKILFQEDRQQFAEVFLRKNLIAAFYSDKKRLQCEYRKPSADGEYFWVRGSINIFESKDTEDIMAVISEEDITNQKEAELALIHKSQHDALTDLYNKSVVQNKIDTFLQSEEGKQDRHAFFIIDIDHFKLVNDNFGHSFGDVVLSQVAGKLKKIFAGNIVGRIGGDEFVAFVKHVSGEHQAADLAVEVCELIHEEYQGQGNTYHISASVGVAMYPQQGDGYEKLYNRSDVALYEAKAAGRDRYALYAPSMETKEAVFNSATKGKQEELSYSKGPFSENVVEYVFRILYEAENIHGAISSVLELLGKHYEVSRAYIYEYSEDGKTMSNTYEWCNFGIEPQQKNLQKLSGSIGDFAGKFDKDGIYYIPDTASRQPYSDSVFEAMNTKSSLQFAIQKEGRLMGIVGFDQCTFYRVPSEREISDMRSIANIIGVFLLDMRAMKKCKASESMALSIVNGLDSYAYVCDTKSYELLFINDMAKAVVPVARIGKPCYSELFAKNQPCKNCPMAKVIAGGGERQTMELHIGNMDIWTKTTATLLEWNDRSACLMDSVDISSYRGRD